MHLNCNSNMQVNDQRCDALKVCAATAPGLQEASTLALRLCGSAAIPMGNELVPKLIQRRPSSAAILRGWYRAQKPESRKHEKITKRHKIHHPGLAPENTKNTEKIRKWPKNYHICVILLFFSYFRGPTRFAFFRSFSYFRGSGVFGSVPPPQDRNNSVTAMVN